MVAAVPACHVGHTWLVNGNVLPPVVHLVHTILSTTLGVLVCRQKDDPSRLVSMPQLPAAMQQPSIPCHPGSRKEVPNVQRSCRHAGRSTSTSTPTNCDSDLSWYSESKDLMDSQMI